MKTTKRGAWGVERGAWGIVTPHAPRLTPHDLPTDDEVIDAIRSVPCHYADLVPVAASMVRVAGTLEAGTSGEALNQGHSVYKDGTTGLWWRTSANTAGKDVCGGICMTTVAAASQPVSILSDAANGQINLGCAVAAGAIYVVSSNLGGIVLYVDGTTPTTGWKTSIVGFGISTSIVQLVLRSSGVAHL